MTDRGDLYRVNLDTVSALIEELDDDALPTAVPATPQWTARRRPAGAALTY